MSGWIKLYRQIMDHELWLRHPFTDGQAWIDLLMLANHKRGHVFVRGVRYPIERGQVGWSERNLAKRWRWSRGKVRRFLLYLEKEQQIVPHKNNVTSVISIVNYETYQHIGTTDSTTSSTTDGPQAVPQTDTNKNVKNVKNVKNIYSDGFETFWRDYPNKKAKGAAWNSWKRLSSEDRKAAKDALPNHKDSKDWKKDNGEYIPHPSTWLNQRRWEDDVGETATKSRAAPETIHCPGCNQDVEKKHWERHANTCKKIVSPFAKNLTKQLTR